MTIVASARSYLDALVHVSARNNALTFARHRAFIATRLMGGSTVLAALPAYMAVRGTPSLPEIEGFVWVVVAIVLAFYLSRTGRYETATALSAAGLCSAATAMAWHTGGINSPAAIWLLLPPAEAALTASRRIAAFAVVSVSLAAVALYFGAADTPRDAARNVFPAIAVFGFAIAYCGGLAWQFQSITATGTALLHAEEDRYRLLARHMTDLITRHGRNGQVIFASPAAHHIFGVDASVLIGQGLFDRVHVADRPAYLNALSDASRGGTPIVQFRVRSDFAPAVFIWVEMRCRRIEDEAAAGRSDVVAVLRDIQDQKRQEDALNEANEALERANAGKNRFLATMSHELRTPLNAIIGFSEMLGNETLVPSAEMRSEYASLINNSGRHLLSVVNGVLDMAKMESGNFEIVPEPFAATPVVAAACDILRLKAHERGVTLDVRLPDDLPDVVADPRALTQIVVNLVSNAIKFSDDGDEVVLTAARNGQFVAFSVEDTGVGIDADDLPRLGEAFFQARASYDRRHDGTGLGLSIVKGLVELHGGKCDIRSRLGHGTCVTIRLPAAPENTKDVAWPRAVQTNDRNPWRTAADEKVKKSA